MNIRNYLDEKISETGAIHLTLIDPDEQDPENAGELASMADSGGTDGIMIGGSTNAGGKLLDETVIEIKKRSDLPTILFPGSLDGVSGEADAIFFLSLLNSKNPFYISGFQKEGAPLVKQSNLEPIPVAYLIIEPGGKVGKVGEANLIKRNDPETAKNYALAAQYLGMNTIYLEAGSGAKTPVPTEMIQKVSDATEITLIVGGGIRKPEEAKERVEAGADIIVTGTIIEEAEEKTEKIRKIVQEIKK